MVHAKQRREGEKRLEASRDKNVVLYRGYHCKTARIVKSGQRKIPSLTHPVAAKIRETNSKALATNAVVAGSFLGG